MTSMQRVWAAEDEPGIEDVRIEQGADQIVIDSVVLRIWEGVPLRATYIMTCDARWQARELHITAMSSLVGAHSVHLFADGAGNWRDSAGQVIAELYSCLDVDIMLTPLTNTLPIRRLALPVGAASEITVVYVEAPTLAVRPFRQRYTRLADAGGRQMYRYESLEDGFRADLVVDVDGFVLDYPDLWRVIWPPG